MPNTPIEDALAHARRSIYLSNRFVSFLTLLLIPLVLGIWVEKAEPPVIGALMFWSVILIIFAIQTFVFVKLDRKASEDTPQLVFEYGELVNLNERLQGYAT